MLSLISFPKEVQRVEQFTLTQVALTQDTVVKITKVMIGQDIVEHCSITCLDVCSPFGVAAAINSLNFCIISSEKFLYLPIL